MNCLLEIKWDYYKNKNEFKVFRRIFLEVSILLFIYNTVVNAAQWPNPSNVGRSGGYYLWEGDFFWFGTKYYPEYRNEDNPYGSWYSDPQLPKTLYGHGSDRLLENGADNNNSREDFGFISYDGYWVEGNEEPPQYNTNKFRFEKLMYAYYRRKETTPRLEEIKFIEDRCNHMYIEDSWGDKEYWFRPNEDIFVNCTSNQNFLGRYQVRLLDYIAHNPIRIRSSSGKQLDFVINRDNRVIASGNTGINLMIQALNTKNLIETYYKIEENATQKDTHIEDYNKKYEDAEINEYTLDDNINVEGIANNLRLNFNEDGGDYSLNFMAHSANGKDTNWGNAKNIKIDGKAPIWDGSIKIVNNSESKYQNQGILDNNITIDGFELEVNNLHDIRGNNYSGVGLNLTSIGEDESRRYNKQYLVIYMLDEKGTKIGNPIYVRKLDVESNYNGEDNYNLKAIIDYDEIGLEDYYGDLSVEFHSYDLLDNHSSEEVKIKKVNPAPIISKAKVIKADYKENESNYWVKPRSNFLIYTDSYIDKSYGSLFPNDITLLLLKDNNIKNKYIIHNCTLDRDEFENNDSDYFYSLIGNSELKNIANDFKNISLNKADRVVIKNRNYLRTIHSMYADEKADKLAFKVYSRSSYNYEGIIDSKEYISDDMDSDIWLKVDGTPPTGTSLFNYNPDTSISEIKAKNVKDNNNGSGLQKVYVRYSVYPYDNYYEPDGDGDYDRSTYNPKPLIKNLTNNNGVWESSTTLYDYFKCSKVVAEVYAVDNVGNENKIGEKTIDLYTLKAWIAPWNDKDSKEEVPILKSGQYAHLYIKTTGGPTELSVEFPYELTELIKESNPNELNRKITIKEELCHIEDVEFCVPLYSPNKEYTVDVTSTKRKGRELYAYPKFRVDDNILNGVRTRLR